MRPILIIAILSVVLMNFVLYSAMPGHIEFMKDRDEPALLQGFRRRRISSSSNSLEQIIAPQEGSVSIIQDHQVLLRSKEQKLHAQACVRNGHGSIYMKHFRKTGGSSLNRALIDENVCRRNPMYASEYPFFDTRTFDFLPDSTVYVTALRHPIDRIISLYWYEGRWPRTCSSECEKSKIKDDSTKVVDLEEWVDAVYHQINLERFHLSPHTSCGQWQSVENYYIRQLLGVDRNGTRFLNKTLTRVDLERAKVILASFDMVLISEHFSGRLYDLDMVRMFMDITGTPWGRSASFYGDNITLPHHRLGVERATLFEEPSPEIISRLEIMNKWDLELYQYAVQLKHRMVHEWRAEQEQASRLRSMDGNITNCGENTPILRSSTMYHRTLGGDGCPRVHRKHQRICVLASERPN